MIKAPRGTADIMPPQSISWAYLEQVLRDISGRYGFSQIHTPVFEHTELFSRTVGETTDIVEKEMYTFKDKTDRDLTLRPEGTASVARAFIERGLAGGPFPQKLFYLGTMYRYEKPQAGRYREFRQYGAEILGSPSPYSDVEVILLSIDIAEELGLLDTKLVINTIGCPVCRSEYKKKLVDRFTRDLDKMCPDCQRRISRNPLRLLDCKNPGCKKITADAPLIQEYLCHECRDHWDKLQSILSFIGIDYDVDTSLVRGLDYYTRTVFELKWPPLGAQDALLGGGRYDGLVEAIGGKPTPGVGFAMGLERIMLAVEKGSKPPKVEQGMDCFVVTLPDEQGIAREKGFVLTRELRRAGLASDFDPLERSMKAQMKNAHRLGAKYVIILGEDEIKRDIASVRSMKDGWQREIPFGEVISALLEEVVGSGRE